MMQRERTQWLAAFVTRLRELLPHVLKRGHRCTEVGIIGQQDRHGAFAIHYTMIPLVYAYTQMLVATTERRRVASPSAKTDGPSRPILMGFFSKKQSSDADRKQRAASEPFVADDQTIAGVTELMRMFNDAVGNFDMVLATAKGISSAAGLGSFEQLLKGNTPADWWMPRPWKMLAAVALRAAQNGDHVLAGRIFGFTWFWGTQIAPCMSRADWVDVLMSGSPPAIEAEIATVGLGSLQQLPDDLIIFGNATGSLTARDLTRAAATVLLDAPEKGVPVDNVVMAAAKRIVD